MRCQYRNPGDQRGSHCTDEYCYDKWKRFPQLSAHQQFPQSRLSLILIRPGLEVFQL
jgi:hypothetical protein